MAQKGKLAGEIWPISVRGECKSNSPKLWFREKQECTKYIPCVIKETKRNQAILTPNILGKLVWCLYKAWSSGTIVVISLFTHLFFLLPQFLATLLKLFCVGIKNSNRSKYSISHGSCFNTISIFRNLSYLEVWVLNIATS